MCAVPASSPQNFSISSVTTSSLYLSWTEPPPEDHNGLIRHYTINIAELDTGLEFNFTTLTTDYTAESLHPYYTYVCSVAAVTIAAGPYSNTVIARTDPDGR